MSRVRDAQREDRHAQRDRYRETVCHSGVAFCLFSFGSSFLRHSSSSSSSSSSFFFSLLRPRDKDKNEKSLLSRFSVRVRRDDRDAPEIDRRGDVFIVHGVHRGGVFGDWDTRQHGRFVVVSSLFFSHRQTL